MKNILLIIAFLYSSLIIGQNGILVPPDNILKAFEKQYPQKKATWSMEYGQKEDDINFEAKFNVAKKTTGYALYDQRGVFKSYKELMSSTKLPKNAQVYLDTNYPVKSNSKAKTKSKSKAKSKAVAAPVREVFNVVDAQGKTRYEVKTKKDNKTYNVIFDAEGNFVKTIQIE